MSKMATKRWKAFDLYKGILIILVVVGHIVYADIDNNIIRYMIYAYHMPLFIGISGFLIDINKWKTKSTIEIIKKYWRRAIMPWLIAVSLYLLWDIVDLFVCAENVQWKNVLILILKRYLHPDYHLWFVMGWMSYIILSYILFKLISNRQIFVCIYVALALLISIVSYENLFHGIVWEVVQFDLRLYNFIFFACGILLRQLYIKYEDKMAKISGWLSVGTIIMLVIVVNGYFHPIPQMKGLIFYTSNIITLTALICIGISGKVPTCKPLEFIGANSLPFYLYHVFAIDTVALFQIITAGSVGYYICTSVLCGIIFFLVYLGNRVPFIRKYLYGNTVELAK